MRCFITVVLSFLVLLTYVQKSSAIYCYQCNSNEETYCSEVFNRDNLALEPALCDGIHEAKYCIKATGMYEGTIGTRRFCSSRHHGNYCEYVKRPGDEREYRSCVYTCYSDGCNHAVSIPKSITLAFISVLMSLFMWQHPNF
uniref:U7-Deinotoxin-Dsu1a_1 n=1 Tax=Deinopis subrufa TaxID=1905329 RepID=A0A4Q8K8T6_DEISU